MGSVHTVRRTSHYSVYPGIIFIDYIQMCKQGLERREVILTAHPSHTIPGPRKGPAKLTHKSARDHKSTGGVSAQDGGILVLALGGAYWYWH